MCAWRWKWGSLVQVCDLRLVDDDGDDEWEEG